MECSLKVVQHEPFAANIVCRGLSPVLDARLTSGMTIGPPGTYRGEVRPTRPNNLPTVCKRVSCTVVRLLVGGCPVRRKNPPGRLEAKPTEQTRLVLGVSPTHLTHCLLEPVTHCASYENPWLHTKQNGVRSPFCCSKCMEQFTKRPSL